VDVVLLQSSVLDLKRLQSGQPAFNVATNLQFVVSDLQELRLGLVGLSLGNDWLALGCGHEAGAGPGAELPQIDLPAPWLAPWLTAANR
jgi:hypothetical protein